jgi:hypothetical protein
MYFLILTLRLPKQMSDRFLLLRLPGRRLLLGQILPHEDAQVISYTTDQEVAYDDCIFGLA